MRILICTDTFFPGIGGTEIACFGYAEELVREGHEVILACPDYHRIDNGKYSFPVFRLPAIPLTANEVMVLVSRCGKFIKAMERFSPDIIQVESWAGMARIALKLGKRIGVPVVMTMHTKLYLSYRQALKSRLLTKAFIRDAVRKLNVADTVVTVAECMRDELAACGYKKSADVSVIRNGSVFEPSVVTEDERSLARREFGFSDEENILLFAGHMIKIKNVEFLLEAYKIASENGFCGKMVLVGRGADEKYFRKRAKQLGIESGVIFTGQIVSREKIALMYACADLFVIASEFDNDPIVVTEAASKGVPTLAIEGYGCSERLKNGVSGFTERYDVNAFGKRIASLFSEKDKLREVGRVATEQVLSHWSETVASYMTLYDKAIDEKAGQKYAVGFSRKQKRTT